MTCDTFGPLMSMRPRSTLTIVCVPAVLVSMR
jgi:hypothetical protein